MVLLLMCRYIFLTVTAPVAPQPPEYRLSPAAMEYRDVLLDRFSVEEHEKLALLVSLLSNDSLAFKHNDSLYYYGYNPTIGNLAEERLVGFGQQLLPFLTSEIKKDSSRKTAILQIASQLDAIDADLALALAGFAAVANDTDDLVEALKALSRSKDVSPIIDSAIARCVSHDNDHVSSMAANAIICRGHRLPSLKNEIIRLIHTRKDVAVFISGDHVDVTSYTEGLILALAVVAPCDTETEVVLKQFLRDSRRRVQDAALAALARTLKSKLYRDQMVAMIESQSLPTSEIRHRVGLLKYANAINHDNLLRVLRAGFRSNDRILRSDIVHAVQMSDVLLSDDASNVLSRLKDTP